MAESFQYGLCEIQSTILPSARSLSAFIARGVGKFVAVPAVMGYNWLLGRNKLLQDALRNFASDLHAYLVSGARMGSEGGGGVRPAAAKAAREE